MKTILSLALISLLLTISCVPRRMPHDIPEEKEPPASPVFDPLATSADREVVPEIYPVQVAAIPESSDSLVKPREGRLTTLDSAVSEANPVDVYRIQIFTSRLYTEANRERALAEEIFNLPIHLDYEVPYYKLRVGDFRTRAEAEDILPQVRTIGYRSAWIARVIQRIRQTPPFDASENPILPGDSVSQAPTDSTDPELLGEND